MSKATKWGLLFLILLFPSLLYITLSTGKHNLFSLPYYGQSSVKAEGDTVYSPIEVQKDLLPVWSDLETCYFVLAFIDPENEMLSSRVGTQLSSLAEKLSPMEDFRIMVLSNGELTEKRELFQAFANDTDKWNFLNFSEGLADFTQRHFSWDTELQDPYNRLYLIDKQNFVRGVYTAQEYSKVKDLSDDVKALKADELIPKKNERISGE